MLNRLQISHIALIDKLDIRFDAGFSALTGETGAGKSILIEAVTFVLGDRASRESIQTGEQKATVEAAFTISPSCAAALYLKEQELYDGEELTLYRELSQSGKNVCRVNGTLVSAAELGKIGDLLVDLHGQHQHQQLLNPKTHVGLLDAFAHSDADGLLTRMRQARSAAVKAANDLAALRQDAAERARRLDVLRYQMQEIDQAALEDGEEDALSADKARIRNAQAIETGLNTAYDALYGDDGALARISAARHALEGIAGYREDWAQARQSTDDAYYALEEVAFSLRDAIADFSFDPDALEKIEERLYLISQLKRKYGADVAEIRRYRAEIEKEHALLDNSEEHIQELTQAHEQALHTFSEAAAALSLRRKDAASALETAIVENLGQMGMQNAAFSARFTPVAPDALHQQGIDDVEFYLSANPGEPEKPLAKVASGGEVSRIMLAFKVALAGADEIDTLVFDEIDTGISGLVANAVAKKMRLLSREHQVLAVTHLPQIAAHADAQYLVYKESDQTAAHTHVKPLSEEERVVEIARIMGSPMNDEPAIRHAAELLRQAQR